MVKKMFFFGVWQASNFSNSSLQHHNSLVAFPCRWKNKRRKAVKAKLKEKRERNGKSRPTAAQKRNKQKTRGKL